MSKKKALGCYSFEDFLIMKAKEEKKDLAMQDPSFIGFLDDETKWRSEQELYLLLEELDNDEFPF